MLVLKNFVSFIFVPLSVVLELLVVGVALLWFSRQQRAAKIVTTTGLGLLGILSTGIVADGLLIPLERKYPPFDVGGPDLVADSGATTYVVVLAGGHVSDPRLPATSQIAEVPMVRLVEGVRIHRRIPGSKLLVSGGTASDPVPEAHVMRDIARQLGVADSNIVVEDQSRNTQGQAVAMAPIVGSRPFVLVTSAWHMPRSMALFRARQMSPIPAPVGHRVKRRGGLRPSAFFPAVRHLQKSTAAGHEYLGLLWGKLRGVF